LGGNHLTNDIAVGIRTPTSEAEQIKHRYGCALAHLVEREETIEVPSVGGRKPRVIARQLLGESIEPRVEEIFMLIKREIEKAGFADILGAGVVVSGGTSILEGLPELAERIFDMPVRRGIPQGVGGLVDMVSSPIYATGVGLVVYGSGQLSKSSKFRVRDTNVYAKVRARMREWFGEFF